MRVKKAETKGILFSDIFINNEEIFINFFERYYQENQNKLDPIIDKLQQVLTQYKAQSITSKKMADDFKEAWDNFEKYILLNNKELELLVSYRGQSGLNATFSQIIPQSEVEGVGINKKGNKQYGVQSGHELVQDTMKKLEASEIEKFLQKHLNDLLNQLDTSINKNEAHLLHQYHTDTLIDSFKFDNEEHLTGVKFREAFYSKSEGYYFGGQGLGKAYDAFMNHIADKKKWVYDYLRYNGLNNKLKSLNDNNNKTVYEEEGKVSKNANFPKLLRDSRNNIGWYTGGDIVIINPETMSIVYNIQLKTTTKNTQSIFLEKVEKIRKFINDFVKDTPKEKAKRIFNFFNTSVSNKKEFNQIVQKDVDTIIEKHLKEYLTN